MVTERLDKESGALRPFASNTQSLVALGSTRALVSTLPPLALVMDSVGKWFSRGANLLQQLFTDAGFVNSSMPSTRFQ